MYVHVCAHGCFCVPRCVGKGLSVFSRVFVCIFTALQVSWHSPGLPRAELQEQREAQYTSFPCRQPKLLLPKPWGRLSTWDVLGERLSWPGVAEHRERGDLLHPVRRTSPIDLRKAGLVPGIFSPLSALIPSGLPLSLANWLSCQSPCNIICTVRTVLLQKGAQLQEADDAETSPVQGWNPYLQWEGIAHI